MHAFLAVLCCDFDVEPSSPPTFVSHHEYLLFRNVSVTGVPDPEDNRTVFEGGSESGGVVIFGRGEAVMRASSRLFIKSLGSGWDGVEMTAYGRYTLDDAEVAGAPFYSGITMVARTNHEISDGGNEDGCSAAGYTATILRSTGQIELGKEYYHKRTAAIFAYPVTFDIPEVDLIDGGLPDGALVVCESV
jgi:hypothetical protein